MADITQSAAEIVNEKWDRSINLADQASQEVSEATQNLAQLFYKPATINVQWTSLPAPALPEVGEIPDLPDIALALPENVPGAFTATMPDVVIDNFDGVAPDVNFGVAPVINIGSVPVLPEVRDVAIPDAPVVTLPDAPEFLALQTHSFGGVNLREDWLAKLEDIPQLTILPPAPYSYAPGARYASQLRDNLQATLNSRIQGATGLAPQVEAKLWGRAADREATIALAREQEVLRSAEALGFPLPSGVLAGQLRDAQREHNDKLSSLSRDISIEQAKLEQANAQQSIQAAIQLEGALMEDHHRYEMLIFESAKAAADNAIQAHNAAVEQFKALLDSYKTYASVYQTVIQAEMNKVEVFKALLQAEQVKADINKSLVDRYKAEIEGTMAAVEIFKARVSAAQTLVELERTRIQAGAEQIKGFVATINAETSKVELYKAQLQGEETKMQVYGEQVKAFGLRVGAQGEMARINLAKFQAQISAKTLEWDGYKTLVGAASAQVDAAAKKSAVIMDGYRIGAYAIEAKARMLDSRWATQIKEYESSTNLAFTAARFNTESVQHAFDAQQDAAKILLATGSQRLAGAWAMVGANASITGGATLTQTISS